MKKLLFFLLSFLALANINAQIVKPVKWSTKVEKLSDSEFNLVMDGKIDEGWHLYSQTEPEGFPGATRFVFTESEAYKLNGSVEEEEAHEEFEPVFEMYKNKVGWFPKVMTQYGYVSLQTVINIGNVLFHQERNRWNWYMVIGGGLDSHRANLDLLRRDLLPYDVSGILDKGLDHNIRSERIKIKKYVDNLYDGTYETPGFQKDGIFKVADKYNVHFVFTGAMGISRKMNKRMKIQ